MTDKTAKWAPEHQVKIVNNETTKSTKRNSGIFSFLKWLRPSTSATSLDSDKTNNNSSSCESLASLRSSGTVASFSYIEPSHYPKNPKQKNIIQPPDTDTYRARLKQRDKSRECDKNLTLRKKYNLFFNLDTLIKSSDETRSLPLPMTKPATAKEEASEEGFHRRTNSDSSKNKKAGAYLHVKGKRKAPPPPSGIEKVPVTTLKRKEKRLAPPPPENSTTTEKPINETGLITNDCLKLDGGFLKPLKIDIDDQNIYSECSPFATNKNPDGAVKPWYKRNETIINQRRDFFKTRQEDKYEPIAMLPDVSFTRNSTTTITSTTSIDDKSKDKDKRKSGVSLLANISELDREAAEILRKEKANELCSDMPEFMRPKFDEQNIAGEGWTSPKRRSARDLIAKFNAITSATKITMNTALFGSTQRKDYFGNKSSPKDIVKKKQEKMLESHKKRIEMIDKKISGAEIVPPAPVPLAKSESACVFKKPETPKTERKSWNCQKCSSENDYWRIICRVCSTIKPYFDDLETSVNSKNHKDKRLFTKEQEEVNKPNQYERILERSRTQIGFSAISNRNSTTDKNIDKKEEKEKLKKMLIDMKNSLPKNSPSGKKAIGTRSSIILENPEQNNENPAYSSSSDNENVPNELETANVTTSAVTTPPPPTPLSILIGTKTTIYENVKMKGQEKPAKISSSAQTTTSALPTKPPEPSKRANVTAVVKKKNSFEPMKRQDFEEIYSDREAATRIYANLACNDELSLFFNVPKNLIDIKNTLSKMKMQNRNTDTVEINRLLRRLEIAIGKGDSNLAADFAKELAQLRVNCSVIRQKRSELGEPDNGDKISVDMYVEDKISHRGPFPLQLNPDLTIGDLKKEIERDFEIPVNVQRWILGKELASQDTTTLRQNNITNGCPIFLYLVAPDKPPQQITQPDDQKPSTSAESNGPPRLYPEIDLSIPAVYAENGPKVIDALPKAPLLNATTTVTTVLHAPCAPESGEWSCHLCTLLNPATSYICNVCASVRKSTPDKSSECRMPPRTYHQLVDLDNEDLVNNTEEFECVVCFATIGVKEGVTLRECLHQFCKQCLRYTIEYCDDAEVKCPYRDSDYSCNIALQDREIKALVTKEIYEQHLAKSMAEAENRMDKSFHCKTPDCRGWCIYEDNVNDFNCPVCKRTNCLTCQAIHIGQNCKEYQQRMTEEAECDEDAKQTRRMLDEMVKEGEALKCPTCQVIMMKKWGCDWLRCSMCKTEICWVTRGPRWGPAGKGDTSGGCRCGVDGVKCHPNCNYCH